ncbi:UNVERIFIED_ORG: DNA polymerase-3 subunit epsilon [Arthrobacter sp. UYEF1]
MSGISFTAIDFETANSNRGSVCAVGLAKVENGRTVESTSWLIKPPEGLDHFDAYNVRVHGIREADVAHAMDWESSVKEILKFMAADQLVAYNAVFDASVMRKASEHVGLTLPGKEFYCGLKLAQAHLELPGHKLPAVMSALSLPEFDHHEAGADARACADIVLAIAALRGFTAISHAWERPADAIGGLYPLPKAPIRRTGTTIRASVRKADLPQPKVGADPDHPFYGKVFCFTGELETYERSEAMQEVAERGASSGNTVTKKTHFVVIGESNATKNLSPAMLSGTGKARKAAEYQAKGQDIAVLCEREFLELLRGGVAPAGVEPHRADPAPVSKEVLIPVREPGAAAAPLPRVPAPSKPRPAQKKPAPASGLWPVLAAVLRAAWKLLSKK